MAALLPPPDSLRPSSLAHRLVYSYANDFFFGTDYYCTQGVTLDVVSPALARLPTHRLLARARPAAPAATAHLRYDGFTPLRIEDAFIRVGGRPYAAYSYA